VRILLRSASGNVGGLYGNGGGSGIAGWDQRLSSGIFLLNLDLRNYHNSYSWSLFMPYPLLEVLCTGRANIVRGEQGKA